MVDAIQKLDIFGDVVQFWLERRPVTPEVASSSLVVPAKFRKRLSETVTSFLLMAYNVYILQSSKDGSYYVGSTQDIEERLERHNQGRTKYTKTNRPWELVYSEEHPDRSSAVKREQEIKKRKSRDYIDKLVS